MTTTTTTTTSKPTKPTKPNKLRPTKPAGQLCCLTIGFDEFIMPAAAGIRVAELMQSARKAQLDYRSVDATRYIVATAPDVKWTTVRATQLTEGAHNGDA